MGEEDAGLEVGDIEGRGLSPSVELTLLVLLPRSEFVSFLGISEGPESTVQVIRMPVMR